MSKLKYILLMILVVTVSYKIFLWNKLNIQKESVHAFIEDNYIVFPSTLNKIHKIVKKELINNLNGIAKNYSEEIRSFTPIASDKEIAEKYLKNPTKLAVARYYAILEQSINGYMLNETEALYEKFLLFSEKNNLNIEIKGDSLPIHPFLSIENNVNLSKEYNEEGVLLNTLDEVLSFIPIAGDIKDIGDINILKTNKNEDIAKQDLYNVINPVFDESIENITKYQKEIKSKFNTEFISYLN